MDGSPDWFADGSFEQTPVAAGRRCCDRLAVPWQFSGNAGIVQQSAARHRRDRRNSRRAATVAKNGWYGFQFKVGPKDLYVYQLGRQVGRGTKTTTRSPCSTRRIQMDRRNEAQD